MNSLQVHQENIFFWLEILLYEGKIMLKYLATRRSVRLFTAEKIHEEKRTRILKAGMLAPTGMGGKNIEFIVIENEATIRELAQVKKHSTRPFATATLAIIVLGNSSQADTWIEEASLAAIFMQLEINSLGLGSTWIQVDKRQNHAGQSSVEFLRERFHFPEHLHPLCVLAVGHKAEDPAPYTEEAFDFSMVHYETY